MSFNYVLIALLIFLVFLLFRVRQSNKSTSYPIPRSKLTKPTPSQAFKSQDDPIKPPSDHLIIAQDFINQQRYDNAIQELKTGLSKQPDNSALMLKLLNVYAVTNNIDHFNSLYDQVLVKADAVTLQQAQNLKIMLDEEAKLQTNKKVKEFESPFAKKGSGNTSQLDFKTELSVQEANDAFSSPSSSLNTEEEKELSFEEIEAQFLNDSQSTMPLDNITSTSDKSNQLKYFTGLEDNTTDNTSTYNTHGSFKGSIKDSNNGLNSHELAFDGTNKIRAKAEQLPSNSINSENPISDKSDYPSEFSLEYDSDDYDINEDKINRVNKTEEYNFDLDENLQDSSNTLTGGHSNSHSRDVSLQQLESGEYSTSTNAFSESVDNSKENALPSLSEWMNSNVEIDSAEDVINGDDYAIVSPIKGDEESILEDTENQNTETQDDEFYKVFDFVKDLDGVQITLDLAQKYLELGEYDSAKRLINEVLESDASDSQKAHAEIILARIT